MSPSSTFITTDFNCFNPRPPKRTLCHISGYFPCGLNMFQSTSSEEDVVSCVALPSASGLFSFNPRPPKRTLCPSAATLASVWSGFNPRPPKRTLCRTLMIHYVITLLVSIHVLRRGRCVRRCADAGLDP